MTMGRPSGPKTRCNGNWTEARYKSFIISGLRQTSKRWAPINEVKKEARVSRGIYRCAGCKKDVPFTYKEGRKRVQNVFVDHIEPVVDPIKGFTTWDEYIARMFVEKEGLQVLCKVCHDQKSEKEKHLRMENKK